MSKKKLKIRTKFLKEQAEKKKFDDYYKLQNLARSVEQERNTSPKVPYRQKKNRHNRRVNKVKRLKDNSSRGEAQIFFCLRKLNIDFVQEKVFIGLCNPETGYSLRFDFYIPEANLCIEFDGMQHFQYSPDFHGENKEAGLKKLQKQQERDRIKDKFCADTHKGLLRIKYSQFNMIEKLIKGKLNECKRLVRERGNV